MKKLVTLFIALILTSLFVSNALATEVTVDKYDFGAYANVFTVKDNHPSDSITYYSAYSQSFRPSYNGANLTTIQLYLSKTATPTGNAVCKIEGSSGTWGSSNVPNGTVYATSANFDISTLTTSLAIVNFTFAAGYVFDSSQVYTMVLYAPASGVTSSSFVNIGNDNTAPILHGGNAAGFLNGAWVADAVNDIVFQIYGNGGELVTFGMGGDVYITEVTNVYNVNATGNINATGAITTGAITAGDVSAGAVTAGDVTASGGTTVNLGGVSADFNNTAVTANAADATITNAVVNATMDGGNVTLTGLSSEAKPSDFEFWLVMVMLIGGFVLMFAPRIPILNFVFGAFSLAIAAATLSSTVLPYTPYINMLLAMSAVLCIVSAAYRLREM